TRAHRPGTRRHATRALRPVAGRTRRARAQDRDRCQEENRTRAAHATVLATLACRYASCDERVHDAPHYEPRLEHERLWRAASDPNALLYATWPSSSKIPSPTSSRPFSEPGTTHRR